MHIGVVFPSVMYREGPQGVQKLIRAIEAIGFDELDMFDHVVMGYPTETRRAPFYTPKMPIMEAFTLLAYAASITQRVKLGTTVLVLPQRNPTLVAKQVSTLDTLSGGRVELGVGVGWQAAEYEALNEAFDDRGARCDEALEILRAYWAHEHVNFSGTHYELDEIAMEPKPPRGAAIPIWIGGTRQPALRRVARYGDGWMAMNAPGDPPLEERLALLRQCCEAEDRDPASVKLHMSLSPDPLDKEQRKRFFADPELLRRRAAELKALGFDHTAIDCVPIFQHGYRTSDAMIDYLGVVHEALRAEVGHP